MPVDGFLVVIDPGVLAAILEGGWVLVSPLPCSRGPVNAHRARKLCCIRMQRSEQGTPPRLVPITRRPFRGGVAGGRGGQPAPQLNAITVPISRAAAARAGG